VRGLGEEEREREEPRGGESEERLERKEETGGDAEERVAAAAQGHREVERRSGGRDRGLEGEDGEPPLADGVAGRAARRGTVHGGYGGGWRGFWKVLNLSILFFFVPLTDGPGGWAYGGFWAFEREEKNAGGRRVPVNVAPGVRT